MLHRKVLMMWAAMLVAVTVLSGLEASTQAQEASGDTWVLTNPGGPVTQVFTPTSGALFAWGQAGLSRSDDGGVTWSTVSLPAATYRVEVDPTDHTVLYAAGPEGLYQSTDDAASWVLRLPTTESVRAIAVSAADHNLVYAALAGRSSPSTEFRFLRSQDRGVTWDQLEQFHNSLCGWDVRLLTPHSTDAAKVFRTAGCYGGRNIGDALQYSADQGTTWTALFRPESAFPARLVGGQGSAPNRFYLASNRDFRAGGSFLHRSDDGQTWIEILTYRGGGTMQELQAPNVTIGGLAYDFLVPDRVYVGLNTPPRDGSAQASAVETSADGGSTWVKLDRDDLGQINDLALGVDGLTLYVATDLGVWQRPVQRSAGLVPD